MRAWTIAIALALVASGCFGSHERLGLSSMDAGRPPGAADAGRPPSPRDAGHDAATPSCGVTPGAIERYYQDGYCWTVRQCCVDSDCPGRASCFANRCVCHVRRCSCVAGSCPGGFECVTSSVVCGECMRGPFIDCESDADCGTIGPCLGGRCVAAPDDCRGPDDEACAVM